jgi:hypothetical protein
MKVTIRTFEGSAEEFERVAHLWQNEAGGEPRDGREPETLTPERRRALLHAALTRLPLQASHARLLYVLAAAGETGVERQALGDELELSQKQLDGVLGSFGSRIRRTPGVESDVPAAERNYLLGLRCERDGRSWRYWVRPELAEVLDTLTLTVYPTSS